MVEKAKYFTVRNLLQFFLSYALSYPLTAILRHARPILRNLAFGIRV